MITTAKVIEVNGKTAVVEAARKSACDGCHRNADGQSCTVCTLLGGERIISTTAKNNVGAAVGDTVEIESATGKILIYALIIFILPLVAAVASYFIAQLCGAGEAMRLLFALVGFAAVMTADVIISKAVGKSRCEVNIVKIITKI